MTLDFPERYLTRFYLKYGRNLRITNYIRAGVFPFFRFKGKKYFVLSISSIGGELSDFAGKKDIGDFCWKQTATRELYEESSKLFNFNPEVLNNSAEVVYDGKCVYSFIELKLNFSGELFLEGFRKNQEKLNAAEDTRYQFKETCGVYIVNETEMQSLLKGEMIGGFKLWGYIRLFFSNGKRWPILKFNKSKHLIDKKNDDDGFIEYIPKKIGIERCLDEVFAF